MGRTNITAFLRWVSQYDPWEDNSDHLGPAELPEVYDQDDREEEEGQDGDERAQRKREKEERILRRVSVMYSCCFFVFYSSFIYRDFLPVYNSFPPLGFSKTVLLFFVFFYSSFIYPGQVIGFHQFTIPSQHWDLIRQSVLSTLHTIPYY